MNKKLISVIASVTFIMSSHTMLAAELSQSVETISTPEQFLQIANNPDGAYVLNKDIDLKGLEWVSTNADFYGTINGQGHVIENLSGKDYMFGGAFAGTLQDVKFEKSGLSVSPVVDGAVLDGVTWADSEKPIANVIKNSAIGEVYSTNAALQKVENSTLSDLVTNDVAVWNMHVQKYLVGYSDGKLHLQDNATKAQFVTLLMKGMPIDKVDVSATYLTADYSQNSWYAGAFNKAIDLGILEANKDGNYLPDTPLTVWEANHILNKAFSVKGMQNKMQGYDGDYKGKVATREDMVHMIYDFLQQVNK